MINRTLEQLSPINHFTLDYFGYTISTIELIITHVEKDELEMLPYFIVKKMVKVGLLKEIES